MVNNLFTLKDDSGNYVEITWDVSASDVVDITGKYSEQSAFSLATISPPGSAYTTTSASVAASTGYFTTSYRSLFEVDFVEKTIGLGDSQGSYAYLYGTDGTTGGTVKLASVSASVATIPIKGTVDTSAAFRFLGGYDGVELMRSSASTRISEPKKKPVTTSSNSYLITNGTTSGTYTLPGTANFLAGVGQFGLVGVSSAGCKLEVENMSTGALTTLVKQSSAGGFTALYIKSEKTYVDNKFGKMFVQYTDGTTYTLYSTDGTVAGTTSLFSASGPITSKTSIIGRDYFTVNGTANQEIWMTDCTKSGTRLALTAKLGDSVTITSGAFKTTNLIETNSSGAVVQRAIIGVSGGSISGSATAAILDGSAGGETVKAGSAGDVLIGGPTDALYGGAGADTFVFHSSFGTEALFNFTTAGSAHDTLQFDRSLFVDWSHLLGAMHQHGSDLTITLDSHDFLTLHNIALANFTQSDARFV